MKIFTSFFCSIFFFQIGFSQVVNQRTFKRKIAKEYKVFSKEEIQNELKMSSKEYLSYRKKEEANRRKYLKTISSSRSRTNLCDNGTFEIGKVNASDWFFEWGGGDNGNYAIDVGFSIKNSGSFTPTNNHSTEVHHQVVGANSDPTFPVLNQVWLNTPPNNSHALRLGNTGVGMGYETISKRIIITDDNSQLKFSYAVVMDNPSGHKNSLPFFEVNIINANNPTIQYNNLVNLGNNSNRISSNNPLLIPNDLTASKRWKDWTCVTADLSSIKGQEVIIEFRNRDCLAGGHWCYTYLDNICLDECGESTEGSISINKDGNCGLPGQIAIDYILPTTANASMDIELQLIQNGKVLSNYNSPTLTSGSTYSFNLNLDNISGINPNLKGFDYKIIGKPKAGNFTFSPKVIGSTLEGEIKGQNNDCPITNYDLPICCPSINEDALKSFFDHIQGGDITTDFKLKFNYSSFYQKLFQAHFDYLKVIHPNLKGLSSHWAIHDAGTGPNPLTRNSTSTKLDEKYTWVNADGNGLQGNGNFFDVPLKINNWYKIRTGIYTEPNVLGDCATQAAHFYYRVVIENGKLVGTLNDGEKNLRKTNLGNEFNLSVCCPSFNQALLMDCFSHTQNKLITSDFQLDFNYNNYYQKLFQTQIDYINVIDPSVTALVTHWVIHDAGTGKDPITSNANNTKLEESWTVSKAGDTMLRGNGDFFNTKLKINNWYKIRTGIYTEPNNIFTDCESKDAHFYYRVSIEDGVPINTILHSKDSRK